MDNHLSNEIINLLKHNRLGINEKTQALEHIAICQDCADLFCNSYSDFDLIAPPTDFINKTIENLPLQKQSSQRIQFWSYTFRVGLAMCASLILIFSGVLNFSTKVNTAKIPSPNLSFMDNVAGNINNFSNKLIIGGFKND